MKQETLKSELIEWLSGLEDSETLDYLKIIKDSKGLQNDWWHDLTDEQKQGIERGLKDVDAERVTPHEIVKLKYGL